MPIVTQQRPRPAKRSAAKPPTSKRQKRTKTTSSSREDRRGWFIVLYGPSGVGKSSLAAHLQDPHFIIDPQEDGIVDLIEYGQCPECPIEEVDCWEGRSGLMTAFDNAASKLSRGSTLVGDSLTGFQSLCFTHHCDKYFGGDWSKEGFLSFQQGPKNAAKTDWPEFLRLGQEVAKAGINVLLLGHAQVKPYSNPEGPDYDRFSPYMEKDVWAATHRVVSNILFYNYYADIQKKGIKAKAKSDSQRRLIYTERQPAFDAKQRFGLPPVIEAGDDAKESATALLEALTNARK